MGKQRDTFWDIYEILRLYSSTIFLMSLKYTIRYWQIENLEWNKMIRTGVWILIFMLNGLEIKKEFFSKLFQIIEHICLLYLWKKKNSDSNHNAVYRKFFFLIFLIFSYCVPQHQYKVKVPHEIKQLSFF